VMDGIRSVFGFGSADLTVLLARVDDLETSDGNDFTSMAGESLFGLELDFDLGGNGSLKGVHYWEQDNSTGSFAFGGEDRMRTYGAQAMFNFDNLDLFAVFSQTDFYNGDTAVLTDDNTAMAVGLNYNPGGNWGGNVFYGMVEGNFGAEGSWGRLGPYHNPANIDVIGGGVWFNVSKSVKLSGTYERFEASNDTDMGAFGILGFDDEVNSFEIGVDFELNNGWDMSLGWENVDGTMFDGDMVDFDWYSIDLNYAVSDNADVAIHYLFSDGQLPIYDGEFGFNDMWKGGILGVQATVRF